MRLPTRPMLLLVVIALVAVAAYAGGLVRLRLDWMSNHWLAEYRASRAT